MIPTLLGVAMLIFLLMRVVPGDIVLMKHSLEGLSTSQEFLNQERAKFGLDKPLWYQFGKWLWDILRGDFGVSMWTGRPIIYELSLRFQLSIQLAFMAMFLSTILAIPLGMIAALKQDTWVDYVIRVFSIAGLATPAFWLGIIIIMFLLILFKWLPPMEFTPLWKDPWANLAQLIFPALAVGYRYSAMVVRMTRSTMLEVLREDYIRTARAKGLRERVVLFRHALRNALIPAVTVMGINMGILLGGSAVIETLFVLPGVGQLVITALYNRDLPVIQGLILYISALYVLINLFVDVLYTYLDPRLRLG